MNWISSSVSLEKWLMATTTGSPKRWMFSMCFFRFSTPLSRASTLGLCSSFGDAAVQLQGADRGHDHHGVGADARLAALDVHEFLGAEVGAEAGLGDGVLGQPHGELRGQDAVAAVGDVGERAAVDEGRVAFQRLHQVGLDGVLQQHGHGAVGLQVGGGDRLAVAGVGDDDPAQAVRRSANDSERQKRPSPRRPR